MLYELNIKLNDLLKKKVNPEIVIKYIYENVYLLLNEIKYIDDNFDIKLNYKNYYLEVIKNSKESWMYSLFPDPIACQFFSLRKMYIGIVGRLTFFSSKNNKYKYWYGDLLNWDLCYKIIIKNNRIINFKQRGFLFFNGYNKNEIGHKTSDELKNFFIVSNTYKLQYRYSREYRSTLMLKQYKLNVNKYYDIRTASLLYRACQRKSKLPLISLKKALKKEIELNNGRKIFI